MADYQLTAGTSIIRTSDGAVIPADPANADWVVYQAWLEIPGNVPDPYVAPPPAPLPRDANARIDAGIASVLTLAVEIRDSLHAIPTGFDATHYAQMMVQLRVLTDAFVSMLQAQADI